jgi:predicted RNA binding protein YcfA (HicA-like mRNA interferase family)
VAAQNRSWASGDGVSKHAKLYQAVRNNPRNVSYRDFEALIRAFGFILDRQQGSHRLYWHPAVRVRLNIQPKGSNAKPYQVKDFLDKVETHGLEMEE